MTDRLHTALATAIAELEWFRIPHTVDQVVGLYSEALGATTMRFRHGLTNVELVEALKASDPDSRGGKGHADPTPAAALAGEPDAIDDDADETLRQIDHDLAMMAAAARELDHLGCDAAAQVRWHPPTPDYGRQGAVGLVVARLHHATPNLAAAHQADPERVAELIRHHIAEPATWLHTKALDIWQASRGEHRPAVVQRPRLHCEDCARHGIQSDVADSSRVRCAKCLRFRREYHVAPTADIVRSWDAGRERLTPGMIAEAKAQAKTRTKRSA